MKKKDFNQLAVLMYAFAVAMVLGTTIVACSDSEEGNTTNPVVADGELDVLGGRLFYTLDADSLDNYLLPVASLRKVEVETLDQSDYYGVRVVERDGERFLQPYMKQEPQPSIETIRLRVTPDQYPEEARHALLVLYKRRPTTDETRASGGGFTSKYSDIIGRTTYPTNELNRQQQMLLSMTRLADLTLPADTLGRYVWGYDTEEYLMANTTNKRIVDFAYDDQSIEEVSHSFNMSLGFNVLFPLKLLFNTGFGYNKHKTEFSSSAFEYMLAMRRVEQATVQFDMTKFEDNGLSGDIALAHHFKVLMAICNSNFIINLLNSSLSTDAFYDYWGTDLICEGTFGGLYTFLYGRQENACGTTSGYDASVNLGVHLMKEAPSMDSVTKAQALLYKFMTDKPSVGGDAKAGWGFDDSEYQEASKSFTVDFTWGGGNGSTDAAWMSGFDNTDNWALVSYSAGATRQTPESLQGDEPAGSSALYPIHKVAQSLLTGYKATFYGLAMTDADKRLIALLEDNVQKLKDAREDYLLKLGQDYEKQPYILADLMMVTTDRDEKTGHPDGEPKPIVRSDPFGVKRIYYPVMANDYAPGDQGYALEVGQPKPLKTKYYINDDNVVKCQYFYYALAPQNETPGIEDVKVKTDGGEFSARYIRRGENSTVGLGYGNLEPHYIYIQYFEDPDNRSNSPITAVVFHVVNGSKKDYIANTGGAELAPGGSTQTNVYDEWSSRTYSLDIYDDWFSSSHWDSNKQYGFNFNIGYTRNPLRIKSIKEINQPKRWGEQ